MMEQCLGIRFSAEQHFSLIMEGFDGSSSGHEEKPEADDDQEFAFVYQVI